MACLIDLPNSEIRFNRDQPRSPAGQVHNTPTNMCGVALGGVDFAAALLLRILQGLNEPGDPPLQRNSLRTQQIQLMLPGGRVNTLDGALGDRRGLGLVGGDVGGELFSYRFQLIEPVGIDHQRGAGGLGMPR